MTTTQQHRSLLQVIEVWKPDPVTGELNLACGDYGSLDSFREATASQAPGAGNAFPARACRERTPLIFRDLYETRFDRFEIAQQAGLTSGIAWPLIDDDKVTAVVLMLCDQSHAASGAFELWKREQRGELGLQGEYYANLDRVSAVSQFIKFPLGAGLPGRVWEERFPRLLSGLGRGSGFARGTEMATAGIQLALGFPIMRRTFDLESVVLMFSAAKTPLAEVIEVWRPQVSEEGETTLRVDHGSYGELTELGKQRRSMTLATGDSLEGKVYQERFPQVVSNLADLPSQYNQRLYSQPLQAAGLHSAFSFPIFVGPNLVSVVTLLR